MFKNFVNVLIQNIFRCIFVEFVPQKIVFRKNHDLPQICFSLVGQIFEYTRIGLRRNIGWSGGRRMDCRGGYVRMHIGKRGGVEEVNHTRSLHARHIILPKVYVYLFAEKVKKALCFMVWPACLRGRMLVYYTIQSVSFFYAKTKSWWWTVRLGVCSPANLFVVWGRPSKVVQVHLTT